jgi:hypothetical protein
MGERHRARLDPAILSTAIYPRHLRISLPNNRFNLGARKADLVDQLQANGRPMPRRHTSPSNEIAGWAVLVEIRSPLATWLVILIQVRHREQAAVERFSDPNHH